jgi:hypothetical protein
MPAPIWYDYAVIRVVPRIERGEFVNVGVVLFSSTAGYLGLRVDLDRAALAALDPTLDVDLVARHLAAWQAIAEGRPEGGPIAAMVPSERFHWLTAPRSTLIQTSPTHQGQGVDPDAALVALMVEFV